MKLTCDQNSENRYSLEIIIFFWRVPLVFRSKPLIENLQSKVGHDRTFVGAKMAGRTLKDPQPALRRWHGKRFNEVARQCQKHILIRIKSGGASRNFVWFNLSGTVLIGRHFCHVSNLFLRKILVWQKHVLRWMS